MALLETLAYERMSLTSGRLTLSCKRGLVTRSIVQQIILDGAVGLVKDFYYDASTTTVLVVRAWQTIMQLLRRGQVSDHELCLPRGPHAESSDQATPKMGIQPSPFDD